MRRILLTGAAIALTFATPASAATLEQAEGLLDYHAASGEKNVVTVTIKKKDLIVTDPGAKMRVKNGDCILVTKHKALCKKMADVPFSAELGNQSDSFRFKGLKNHFGTTNPEQVAAFPPAPATRASIDGGPGNDSISGSPDGDLLIPGTGRDRVDGGDGDDVIEVTPDKSNDRLLGGRGVDTIEVTGRKAVNIDLDADELTAGSEDDLLDGFEVAQGGDGNDTLTGSPGTDELIGGGGSDTIDGGGGDDVLDARDSDADGLDCGAGNDVIFAGPQDLVTGCESSASGVFTGPEDGQSLDLDSLAAVVPVARGADGAPTYTIACPTGLACNGTLTLTGPSGDALGSAPFSIPAGQTANVAVTLTDAGKAALVQPGARVSVHVQGSGVDYGWQQQLGT